MNTFVVAGLCLAPSMTAGAQSTSAQELKFARYLIGTWQCSDTVGDQTGNYTTTITPSLDARWLRQTYTWKATEQTQPLSGEYFLSFDPRVQSWIRMGAMNDGMYFGMVGKRSGDTLSFRYVLPSTAGNAVYVKRSDREYTVLGPSYPENGKQVTEHHGCHKVS